MVKVKEPMVKTQAYSDAPVIGHQEIISFFDHVLSADRLAHAYLFIGPGQVGKMAVARKLAARVLGSGGPLERHPDFLVVERGRDAKSGKLHADIVLDQIHVLRGWLARGAFISARAGAGAATGWKAVIIDGAQYLNKEAANALLKNLEEPKDKTLIILLTEAADGVYPTIRSRCQTVSFGRVRAAEIARVLAADGLPAGRAELLSRLAGGCPGRALAFARDGSALEEMLARRDALLALIDADVSERWVLLEKALPAKLSFNETVIQAIRLLDLLAELLRDALLIGYGRAGSLTHVDVKDRLESWAARAGSSRITAVLQEIDEARRLLGENVNPRAVLESLVLSLS